jgi:hypothetical protein
MAYTDIYTAATDPTHTLRKQVSVAMMKAAVDVSNEAANTENHENRIWWANQVLASNQGPVIYAERWIWKVMEDAGIAANPTGASDSAVQNAVNSFIDLMGKVGK